MRGIAKGFLGRLACRVNKDPLPVMAAAYEAAVDWLGAAVTRYCDAVIDGIQSALDWLWYG